MPAESCRFDHHVFQKKNMFCSIYPARAALESFNSTCQPNEKAVVIDKDRYGYRRNIFGQPTIWALTFIMAVQLEEEKKKDISRMRTSKLPK